MIDLHTPPHSIESEQSLLGALLLDERAWDRVIDVVSESDFYVEDHRKIFRAMTRLFEQQKPVDVLTVFETLGSNNETCGGLAYLGELAQSAGSAANARRYAEIVAERRLLRELLAASYDIQGLAMDRVGPPAMDRIDASLAKLMALSESRPGKSEPRRVSELIGGVIDDIDARFKGGGGISGLPCGFKDLDGLLDGFQKGDLIILAARPSMGKTALCSNIAENVSLSGKAVLFFSQEMSERQLLFRSISSLGSINIKSLKSGQLKDGEFTQLTFASSRLYESNLYIDDTPCLTVGQMRARARRVKRKEGLDLIIVDYIQIMKGEGNNRNEEVGSLSRGLKALAKDLDVPVIALSQLSRKVEDRADKRPVMSDLRDSGSLEQDADVIIFIYRDEYHNPDTPYKGTAELLVRKNRMGETGEVRLIFQGQYSRFKDMAPGVWQELEAQQQDSMPMNRKAKKF